MPSEKANDSGPASTGSQVLIHRSDKIVSTEWAGKADDKPAKGDQAVIKGGKLVLVTGENKQELTFTVAPGKDPKQIDLTPKDGPKGYYLPGIYKLEKDVLVICYALPIRPENIDKRRPSEFKTGPQSYTQIVTLKRTQAE